MITCKGYAAYSKTSKLKPFLFNRRALGDNDVLIDIAFSGVCHSDIHQARDEWGGSTYPMVPGHEIAGVISAVGKKVKKFKVGDKAGVGCFVDSCRKCLSCKEGVEQYCEGHISWTYNGTLQDQKTPTFGGYSNKIVVDQNYCVRIPSSIDLKYAAPLLCAGITTYSPLRFFKIQKKQKVAIVGMGGLGHMAVKIAAAMGAEVTVISSSIHKKKDALKFGAKHFICSKNSKAMTQTVGAFDYILDTVSAEHDMDVYLGLLKRDGLMTIVGVPEKPMTIKAFSLIVKRKKLSGSVIGGIQETQEMLNFCAKHNIRPEIELISSTQINEAYERTIKADVRYRFVIDAKTF